MFRCLYKTKSTRSQFEIRCKSTALSIAWVCVDRYVHLSNKKATLSDCLKIKVLGGIEKFC